MQSNLNVFFRVTFFVTFCTALLPACGGSTQDSEVDGIVLRSQGSVTVERGEESLALKKDMPLLEGDIVKTGADGLMLAKMMGGDVDLELQKNAVFHVASIRGEKKVLRLKEGNLWLRVNKMQRNHTFNLHTPTTIAGVRGTKFYTFDFKDPQGRSIHGTCHCEGEVDYQVPGNEYHELHKEDYTTFTRDGKTIVVYPEEMEAAAPGMAEHQHSHLKDSHLGPAEEELTPEQAAALMALLEKKFAEQ